MRNDSEKVKHIKNELLRKIDAGIPDFVRSAADAFGVSSSSIYRYLNQMQDDGLIRKNGGKWEDALNNVSISLNLNEKENASVNPELIYQQHIEKFINPLSQNVQEIWKYVFKEILNNALEHSSACNINISLLKKHSCTEMVIRDDGVGIFSKIMESIGCSRIEDSVLELFKGKLTADPLAHAGNGIFFCTRIPDSFCIFSSKQTYAYGECTKWFSDSLYSQIRTVKSGTMVWMRLYDYSDKNLSALISQFSDKSGNVVKTCLPVKNMIGTFPVSRSQAKRLCNRLEDFHEVELDFADVDEIGQGFAHELFVVFHNNHEDVKLLPVNFSDDVRKMMKHVGFF